MASDEETYEAAILFWTNKAHQAPEGATLAERLGLRMPRNNPRGFRASIKYPMRRLVITGGDVPENFYLFFGVDADAGSLANIHAETRREVLLMASVQHGSPHDMMRGLYDEGCPEFSPRPAGRAEKEELQRIINSSAKYVDLLGASG
ncbi:hypothetical protein GQ53DRAFT_841633 [Thozetella sp. PMI_491]|nr:hypothetical protein GQ53DRAFT_841633 [Thozetella sp. PMI_491]